jgi:hypothetical protein
MQAQQLTPEEIVDDVDEPRDAPPSATVVRWQWLRWILENTPGLLERNPNVTELKARVHDFRVERGDVAAGPEEV